MTTTKMPLLDASDRDQDVKVLLTSGEVTACYYVSRPDQRPDCERLAVVRYGPTPLCADCARRRSAVGKGMVVAPLPDPSTLVDIAATRWACAQGEAALSAAVVRARRATQPCSASGAVPDTTRQAAQQRFAAHARPHADQP